MGPKRGLCVSRKMFCDQCQKQVPFLSFYYYLTYFNPFTDNGRIVYCVSCRQKCFRPI